MGYSGQNSAYYSPYAPPMPGGGQLPVGGPLGASPSSYGQPVSPVLLASLQTPGGYPAQLYQLPNGHRVLLEQRPTDIVSLRTFIKTGSINEDPIYPSALYGALGFPSGIAHLDEHCHFLTTQNYRQKNSWVAAVQQMGAQLNATTSPEWIQHELTFSKDKFQPMLAMHGEAVMRPLYTDEALPQEKRNVINEALERTSAPMAKVQNKLWELMFDRPMFQTLGTQSDIMRTTAQQLQRFYDTYYTPNNMLTVISGQVSPQEALAAVGQQFGQNPPKPMMPPTADVRMALRPGQRRSATVYDPKLTQSMVNLAFPAPGRMDIRERVAVELLMQHLTGGETSVLNVTLRDQQKVARQIGADYQCLRSTGLAQFGLQCDPGQESTALAALLTQLAKLGQSGIPGDQLQVLKNRMMYGFRKHLNDAEQSSMFLGDELLSDSMPYYLQFQQTLQSLTPQEVLAAAQKYLSPRQYAVVFGVPGPTTPTGLEDLPPTRQGGTQ